MCIDHHPRLTKLLDRITKSTLNAVGRRLLRQAEVLRVDHASATLRDDGVQHRLQMAAHDVGPVYVTRAPVQLKARLAVHAAVEHLLQKLRVVLHAENGLLRVRVRAILRVRHTTLRRINRQRYTYVDRLYVA